MAFRSIRDALTASPKESKKPDRMDKLKKIAERRAEGYIPLNDDPEKIDQPARISIFNRKTKPSNASSGLRTVLVIKNREPVSLENLTEVLLDHIGGQQYEGDKKETAQARLDCRDEKMITAIAENTAKIKREEREKLFRAWRGVSFIFDVAPPFDVVSPSGVETPSELELINEIQESTGDYKPPEFKSAASRPE